MLAPLCAQASHGDGRARVLFLTHSAGYQHQVVARGEDGTLSLAERQLASYTAGQYLIESSQDCSLISAEHLRDYAAVVFYTTGELPISERQRSALLAFVRDGGGFVGIHSATDTFYDFPEYGELLGGSFDGHPWHQQVTFRVEQPIHPAVAHLGKSFTLHEEIYQFKNWQRKNQRVLISLDPDSVDITKGKRADQDYATAWCRDYGLGRVFYTALGHGQQTWQDQRFLRHVGAAIRWVMDARGQFALPPAGAVLLLSPGDNSAWQHRDARACEWEFVDAALQVKPGSGDIISKQKFSDFRLHLEFRCPLMAAAKGQARANSGVYLLGAYELQILDSYGLSPQLGDCGAIYNMRSPDVNACRPPEQWQSYDIMFRAATFDEAGNKTGKAMITAIQNGILIHEAVEVDGPTAGGSEEPATGPILLQDHRDRLRFRNIWVLPL